MKDKEEKAEAGESKASALGLGERLRSARKARALSLEQVAESLHLDETLVLALEAEQFESMGAPVFVRGHLKAYARLVGLSEDALLDAYRSADPASEAVPHIARETNRSVTINPFTWAIWALVVLLVTILAIYVLQDDEPPASIRRERPPPPVVEPVEQLPAAESPLLQQPESEPAIEVSPEPAIEASPERVSETPVRDEPAVPVAPEPVDTSVRLTLVFARESWVEISDANRRLLFGLQRAGRRRELVGDPPFDLLIGDARDVEVYLNDKPYSIPRQNVTGKVARFEISSRDLE